MTVRELSVFFPCFNEEANVEIVVDRALAVLRDRDLDRFEVIVVDDGSSDETGVRADKLAARYDEVRVVHHVQNQGYGAALRSGFGAAALPWVFLTDGDGQFDLNEIDFFLAAADQAEVVIGYRRERADHFGRRVNTWFGPLTASGAVISTELLVGVRRARIPIVEIGVHHYPRHAGSPSGASRRVILRALRELVNLRIRDWRRGRPA
jgi:glycosyltransferase involved in cell wall biosynthesis